MKDYVCQTCEQPIDHNETCSNCYPDKSEWEKAMSLCPWGEGYNRHTICAANKEPCEYTNCTPWMAAKGGTL